MKYSRLFSLLFFQYTLPMTFQITEVIFKETVSHYIFTLENELAKNESAMSALILL